MNAPSAPAPTITSITPNPITADAANGYQTLTINGTNFVSKPNITLTWTGQSGYALPASQVTFISSTQLSISVKLGAAADSWTVKATNPDGKSSSAVGFTVNAPSAPAPTITSITPNPLTYGSSADTITINGTNFVSGCTVTLKYLPDGSTYPKSVTYISSTQLQVTANFTNVTATWSAQVTAPTASNTIQFQVNAATAAPTITSITPNPLTYGSSADTITINGTNFVSGCTVTLKYLPDGSTYPKSVTYISSTQLQVTANFTNVTATWSAQVTAPTASNTIQFQVNAATASFYLSFPLSGYTPYNAPITSVFDHSGGRYAADQKVVAYTGEVGNVPDGTKPVVVVVNGVSVSLYSYKKADGRPFLVNKVNYIGTGTIGASSLNYDGHPGYDYPVPLGTEVYAAADGAVETANTNASDPAGIYIRVQHDSAGYQTQYLHLSQILVSQGTTVTRRAIDRLFWKYWTREYRTASSFEVKKKCYICARFVDFR